MRTVLRRSAGHHQSPPKATHLEQASIIGILREKRRSMSNTSIENATTLNLSLRLRGGGKVHGSLARAGKVKGQTPKVPKQEDSKKALTGRAKKRWQYNRRFVNVVAGMGGKKLGPNSNAAKQ
ncbi:hypothetical protein KRP22_015091 [Phytophthora ramorum]|nr:40S ribosomal protein S30 [Phytophthora ramorum]